MKKKAIILMLMIAVALPSCETVKNTNKTQRGAAAGAVGGAALGALIGGKDNRALGAIIGAVVGGAAGGYIGNRMDKEAREIENTLPGAEVVRTAEGIQIILDEKSDVRFEFNKSDLTADSKANLIALIDIFKRYPDTNILVVGHTDSKGSEEYNQALSERRAASVKDYLEAQGIDSERLSAEGVGETQPRADNETEAGRSANRRVEFAITASEELIEEAKEQTGEGQ